MNSTILFTISIFLIIFSTMAKAEPVLMSADWAKQACDAWNQDAALTEGLYESDWIKNDLERGHKIIILYRTDCADSKRAELKISAAEGKAECTYGGKVVDKTVDKRADYIMHATTQRWMEMGAGKYGPMKAMMLRRLKFKGPKMEAMGNMGPFKNFLLLAGSVPSDTSSCP
ncbi:MAG: SCP2 sterol-binding domain-containing protein [Gammaproteobacteria bacterium]